MVRVVLASLLSIALAKPPPHGQYAKVARWMVQNLNYGVLSTTSARSEASTVGDPFGNPYSFADSEGIPYFYASDLDASMVDIFTASEPSTRVSFAMSEAQLTGKASVKACEIGGLLNPFGDPENPPCARLVLSGNFVRLAANSTEEATAKAALFERHPSFANFPSDHGFFAAKLEIDGIWLIDFYGGAPTVTPEEYFAASSNLYRAAEMRPVRSVDPRPDPLQKIKTARWMVKTLNWGVLATTSSRTEGSTPGDAFGNPYAFADASNGIPYFWASDLDASIVDLNVSTRMTFALSEATLAGTSDEVKACTIGEGFGDAENPPCARLVFSGDFVRVDASSDEYTSARAAMFDRHPSFKHLPGDHGFFLGKLEIDAIWMIDMYGGATNMDVSKYLADSEEELVV